MNIHLMNELYLVLIDPNQLQTQEKYLNFQEELVYSDYLKGKYAFNNYASSLPQTCFFIKALNY